MTETFVVMETKWWRPTASIIWCICVIVVPGIVCKRGSDDTGGGGGTSNRAFRQNTSCTVGLFQEFVCFCLSFLFVCLFLSFLFVCLLSLASFILLWDASQSTNRTLGQFQDFLFCFLCVCLLFGDFVFVFLFVCLLSYVLPNCGMLRVQKFGPFCRKSTAIISFRLLFVCAWDRSSVASCTTKNSVEFQRLWCIQIIFSRSSRLMLQMFCLQHLQSFVTCKWWCCNHSGNSYVWRTVASYKRWYWSPSLQIVTLEEQSPVTNDDTEVLPYRSYACRTVVCCKWYRSPLVQMLRFQ